MARQASLSLAIRRKVAVFEHVESAAMIPEGELDVENRRNGPPAPPPLPVDADGLILPRKPHNPCLDSSDRKSLHRELLFNQKTGKNVLNQKTELQRAFGKHKEQQVRKEKEEEKKSSMSDLQRLIEERHKRLERLEKEEESGKYLGAEPEFLKVHAKLRSRMDSK